MKNRVFILYFFITIVFFGMLIKLEYATDTYAVFNFDKEAVYMQYAMSGRFITGTFLKFFKMINIPEKSMYAISCMLAIFCATLSQFILHKLLEEDIKSKILKIIIPTLIIINPFSIELFLFIEKGFMWLGILACVFALMNFKKYFDNSKSNSLEYDKKTKEMLLKNLGSKRYLLYSLIFMFIANCLYQGVVGLFLSVALVYILKYSKNIRKVASPYVQVASQPHESKKLNLVAPEKSDDFSYTIRKVASPHVQVASEKSSDFSYAIKEFIVNNIIAGSIYAIPALINFLFVKIKFKESRVNGQIVILDSLEKIWQNTINIFKTMYGILPKYTFILLILFTFAFFCSKIWKEEKKLLLILKFVYILVGITFIAIAPQILQPTNLIWFGPRSTYSFASMYGVLTLYLAMNYELEGISKYAIIIFSVILLTFQAQKFIKIEKDRYLLNKNDLSIIMQVKKQIDEYEKQTGNIITELSWYEDEKPNFTYNGIFVTSDMNVKSYSSDWSTVEILKYYLKRDIKLVKRDENLEKLFKSKNWNEFDEEQILFENNKLHLCNY